MPLRGWLRRPSAGRGVGGRRPPCSYMRGVAAFKVSKILGVFFKMFVDRNHETTPVLIPSRCLTPDGGVDRGSAELANRAVLPSATGQLLPYGGVVTRDRRPQ